MNDRLGRQQAPTTARSVALSVLRSVESSDAYANLLLPSRLREAGLSRADAAFATELVGGTLRRRGTLDAVIALAAGRPVSDIDPDLLDILRLGVYQLLELRTPTHAAVHETVELVPGAGRRGFVNGVLRTVSRTSPDEWRTRIVAEADGPITQLAIAESHPEWVVRALERALGAEGAEDELLALLRADNLAPRVNLVALPGFSEPDELIDAGGAPTVSPLGVAAPAGDPARLPAVSEGRARVQDAGSQLAALALVAARPVASGEIWVDMCAGPGGKAALLAAAARRHDAQVDAIEVQPHRARLVERALERVAPEVVVETGDARYLGEDRPAQYDRVLLDAPCTGLGALRRRPESRWRRQPSDVPQLAELQRELLDSALDTVKPGGLVAYVTCSPHLAETRAIVDRVLRDRDDVRRLDAAAVVGELINADALVEGVTQPAGLGDRGGDAQLWPHRHGTDAMFISLIERTREPSDASS